MEFSVFGRRHIRFGAEGADEGGERAEAHRLCHLGQGHTAKDEPTALGDAPTGKIVGNARVKVLTEQTRDVLARVKEMLRDITNRSDARVVAVDVIAQGADAVGEHFLGGDGEAEHRFP